MPKPGEIRFVSPVLKLVTAIFVVLGAVIGSFLGSPFPPAVYIGHPGWKAVGGRIGYSLLTGVVIGLGSAFGLARVIANLLYGVTARDPLVFAAVPLVLTAVAFIGVWLPARRAVAVDPVVALRTE